MCAMDILSSLIWEDRASRRAGEASRRDDVTETSAAKPAPWKQHHRQQEPPPVPPRRFRQEVAGDLEIVSRVRGETEEETERPDSAQGRQDARGSAKVKDDSDVSSY